MPESREMAGVENEMPDLLVEPTGYNVQACSSIKYKIAFCVVDPGLDEKMPVFTDSNWNARLSHNGSAIKPAEED